MIPLAIGAGLLIGLSLGALGGGGSILTVPVLVYLLGQSPHAATAASLRVVGLAAAAGAVTHARAGRVRWRTGLMFGVLGVAGSYAGSRASAAVPPTALLAGFGVLMLVVAATMVARGPGQVRARPVMSMAGVTARARARPPVPAGPTPPGGETASRGRAGATRSRHPALVAAAATGVGLITGFFGVGGGFVVVPVLVLLLGLDMAAAAGTSLVVITIDSAAALAARAWHGGMALDWPLIAAFTVAAVGGATMGGRWAGRLSPQRLTAAFTVLIVVVACYTLARSTAGLL